MGRYELPKNLCVCLEDALPFQTDNRSRRIKKDKRNLECKSYSYEDLVVLVQTFFRFCAFCRIIEHVIIECP